MNPTRHADPISRRRSRDHLVRLPWLSVLACTALWFQPASAVPYDGSPKLLLHLTGVTQKSACAAGQLADCGSAVTAGSVASGAGPFYFAYVVAARGDVPDLAGVQFGIRYQEGCVLGRQDGQRIDVLGWTHCGALEFPTGGFHAWPGPNSSNLISWNGMTNCQTGATMVAGYFYVACYGTADTLRIIPRPVDQRAKLARCSSVEIELTTADLGSAVFSPGGSDPGCNPCMGPCPSPPTYLTCGAGVDITPPAVVTLSLQQRTDSAITVRWQAPGDDGTGGGPAATYDLRWFGSSLSDPPSGTPVPGLPVPATPGTLQSATLSGLPRGTTFSFVMRTADEVPNWSDNSLQLSVTTLFTAPDLVPPSAISDLAQVSAGVQTCRVGWTATGDDGDAGTASSYEMRRASAPITTEAEFANALPVTPLPVPSVAGTHQEAVITGLAPAATWYVAIRAIDEGGNASPLSNSPPCTTRAHTESTPPDAITDLVAITGSTDGVRLGWTATGDDGSEGTAASYDVRFSLAPITDANFEDATPAPGAPVPLPAGTHQELLVTNVIGDLFYYFALRVIDDEENVSPLSNVVTRRASDNAGARLLLHTRAVTTKNPCEAGRLDDCVDAVTDNGALYPALHYTYLIAGQFGEIGALQCGIQYDLGAADGQSNHRGIDIYGWSHCADAESPSTTPTWPKPGSGNRISWNAETACQKGGTAVAGYFYLAAFGIDHLFVLPHSSESLARVFECSGLATTVQSDFVGIAGFGTTGYNPCIGYDGDLLPVRPTTWSRIKTLLRN
jgi:hypothetical protein